MNFANDMAFRSIYFTKIASVYSDMLVSRQFVPVSMQNWILGTVSKTFLLQPIPAISST